MNTIYTKTHDIDWFYIISGTPIHVASAGGELPLGIKSLKELRMCQRLIDELPPEAEVILNKRYVSQIIQKDYREFEGNLFPPKNDLNPDMDDTLSLAEKCYYNTFFSMAQRGFYSFDRNIDVDGEDKELYHLVAKPKREVNMEKIQKLGIPSLEKVDILFDFSSTEIPLVQLINDIIKSS